MTRAWLRLGVRSILRQSLLGAGLWFTAAAGWAFGRVDFDPGDGSFSDSALVRGVRATAAQCAAAKDFVWAQPEGSEGECLRYWSAGLDGAGKVVPLFFFGGDLLDGSRPVSSAYSNQNPAKVQAEVDAIAARLEVPYVFIGRPGTYGSSGEHRQRRRQAESQLISAAIDEIKRRHGLRDIAIAGQSGGGHVVASLLGYRSDVVCAVPTSAVSSPRMRWTQMNARTDTTGYADSYEPTEHLDRSRMNPALRVFVLGDPNDGNVPWSTQTVLADRLRALGVPVELLTGEGRGSMHHGLARSATQIAALCAKGASTEHILERASRGLNG